MASKAEDSVFLLQLMTSSTLHCSASLSFSCNTILQLHLIACGREREKKRKKRKEEKKGKKKKEKKEDFNFQTSVQYQIHTLICIL